jgi:hypothetical protein
MQGFTDDWINPSAHRSRAPTFGSLLSPDIILTEAYYEQVYQIGSSSSF